jgi:hypothetical protein
MTLVLNKNEVSKYSSVSLGKMRASDINLCPNTRTA